MTAKEKIIPPLVLTLICVISSALLVIAYNLTHSDTTGVITDKLQNGLTELYGGCEDFEMLINEDGTVFAPQGVTSVLSDSKGNIAFEVVSDGYNKGGLHLLIGFDKGGSVCGISVLSISETPGLGTKIQDKTYLSSFAGISSPDFKADVITRATMSSKGVANAVRTAVKAYSQIKEDVGNG